MRRIIFLTTALLLLISAALAQAKGLKSARACGSSGCTTTTLHDEFPGPLTIPPVMMSSRQLASPPAAAPWYRVAFRFTGMPREIEVALLADHSYVGGRDTSNGEYYWQRTSAAEARTYGRFTGGLVPLPAGKLPGIPARARAERTDGTGSAPVGGGDRAEAAEGIATADEGIATADEGSAGGFPWALAAGIGGILLAAAVVSGPLRRATRSRRGAPRPG
jgi:hypothetical protein